MNKITTLFFFVIIVFNAKAQHNVGIGTTNPHASAALDVTSNSRGVLLPRLTYAQRVAINNPADGLMVYQTDGISGIYNYIGSKWYVARYDLEPRQIFVLKDSFFVSSANKTYAINKGVQKIRLTIQGAQGGDGIFGIQDESNYRYSGFTTKYGQGQNGEQHIAIMNVQENDTILVVPGTKPITTPTNMSGGLPGGLPGIKNSWNEFITVVHGGGFGAISGYNYTYFHHYAGGSGGASQVFLKRNGVTTLLASVKGGNGGVVPTSLIPNAGNNPIGYNAFINSISPGIAPPSTFENSYFVSTGLSVSTTGDGFVFVEEFLDNNKVVSNSSSSGSNISITYANTTSDGIITSANFNTFNNKGTFNLPALTSGSVLFSNGNTIAQNNANMFWDNTNNRLGVGTTIPNATLSINSTNVGSGYTNWIAADFGATTGARVVTGLLNGKAAIGGHTAGFGGWADFIINGGGGNVGIGTETPTHTLHVNGTVAGNSAYTNLSDARFKTNVKNIQNPLQKILALRGITFDWNLQKAGNRKLDGLNHIGFLAQEVEKILPQVVSTATDADKTKTLSYADVVPVLVEAIKEQQKQIDLLRIEIIKLKKGVK